MTPEEFVAADDEALTTEELLDEWKDNLIVDFVETEKPVDVVPETEDDESGCLIKTARESPKRANQLKQFCVCIHFGFGAGTSLFLQIQLYLQIYGQKYIGQFKYIDIVIDDFRDARAMRYESRYRLTFAGQLRRVHQEITWNSQNARFSNRIYLWFRKT